MTKEYTNEQREKVSNNLIKPLVARFGRIEEENGVDKNVIFDDFVMAFRNFSPEDLQTIASAYVREARTRKFPMIGHLYAVAKDLRITPTQKYQENTVEPIKLKSQFELKMEKMDNQDYYKKKAVEFYLQHKPVIKRELDMMAEPLKSTLQSLLASNIYDYISAIGKSNDFCLQEGIEC